MNQTTKIMKKLVLILSLIPALVFSQDSVELKTLQYLNEYRSSKGLSQLVIDKGLCKAAEHQVKYELLSDSVTHFQFQDFPGFDEISDPDERIKHFSGLDCPFGRQEITLGGKGSLKGFNYFNKDLAKKIIESFKLSPGHNEAMIHRDAHKVGIKIVKDQNYILGGEAGIRYFCVITFGI
jgi:hypothetical protein